MIIQSLLTLLRPLTWSFINISFLTNDFLEAIESPFPYIIGVSKEIWEKTFVISIDEMNFDEYFFKNTVIFDIDNDLIQKKIDNEVPKEKTY